MHPDVTALLAVQDDDVAIHELETRLAALRPRLEALARERDKALAALTQAKQTAESEERRRTDVAARVTQHKALHEKHQSALNGVTSMREATAATAQIEQAKRMIDEDERELATIGQRSQEARHIVEERQQQADELERAQAEAQSSLSTQQQEIEAQLAHARASRQGKATKVPRSLLSQYERIRSRKRIHAVFPLNGQSCGNCDTVIPLQRRSAMSASSRTEVCEECGVMLYATD